jgi:hypothetical protein
VAGIVPAKAVIFYSTADSSHNTSATGTIAETAWSYEGQWGSYLGTAIGSHFFITAKHVGGSDGNSFVLNGVSYTTTQHFDAPAGDLRIWRVSGTLPYYAPLYLNNDEVGKSLVVIGRGTQRGAEVSVDGASKGWKQGTSDHVQRWGENVVSSTTIVNGGYCLAAEFNGNGGSNEAHLSVGDSGGAVFIRDTSDSRWKLAGINYAVDGNWSYTGGSDAGFRAAIFDEGGLYIGRANNWSYVADEDDDIPSRFHATRISSYQNWIVSVVPEPANAFLLLPTLFAAAMSRRRWRGRAQGSYAWGCSGEIKPRI